MQINSKLLLLIVVIFLVTSTIGQDYDDDYARRNRRRRPQQQQQQYYGGGGPCGRFLSYVNLNYNVDCSGHGSHGGGGSIDDFIGGNGGQGSHGGQGGGNRPQKPNRPFGGFGGGSAGGGTFADISNGPAGFFNGPIWGTIGAFATNIGSSVGNTVGSFTNGFNEVGGGEGGHFFDGSIINSFTSLFSNNPGGGSGSPSRPPRPIPNPSPVTDRPEPITNRPSTGSTGGLPDVDQHPVVPIVDLRPVHEDYYDEVTEQTLYGSTNSKFLNSGRYVSGGGGHHHNHNGGGLFDINYNRAFKKINRQINHAINYLFRR